MTPHRYLYLFPVNKRVRKSFPSTNSSDQEQGGDAEESERPVRWFPLRRNQVVAKNGDVCTDTSEFDFDIDVDIDHVNALLQR